MKKGYQITGKGQYAVTDSKGGVLYDLLSRQEAIDIRDVLNDGIGPDWGAVESELIKRGWAGATGTVILEEEEYAAKS